MRRAGYNLLVSQPILFEPRFMNPIPDLLLDDARRLSARHGLRYSVTRHVHDEWMVESRDHDAPPTSVDALGACLIGADWWTVYPSGLALPLHRINWFWEFEHELRLGSAEQAVRYCRRRRLDPANVWPVDPDRVHGTCVRYGDADYRLVQARSFPAWVGY